MLGPLLGAAASIGGSLLGAKASKDANKAAAAEARHQEQVQREFAQSGIQWKVADAKKAGVHPLYALGANTVSYSPQTIGQSVPDYSGLGEAGQNIGRAVEQTMDPTSRTIARLGVERAGLENELLRSQIAQTRMQTTGIPALSPFEQIPGQHPVIDGTVLEMPGQRQSVMLPPHHDYKKPQFTTNVRGAGSDWAPHPGFSDSQTMEDRYGEISDFVYGPIVGMADYWYNHVRPYRAKSRNNM